MGVHFLDPFRDEAIITLLTTSRRYWLFGPVERTVRRYRGKCTVWHDAETGQRCSTMQESRLADIWQKAMWERRT